MPTDPRKRQKALQRKAARRKDKKHVAVREKSTSLAARFSLAAAAPVLHCWISETNWSHGLGPALLSRALPDGRVAVAIFLVDRYCLGVKNVLVAVTNRSAYNLRNQELRAKNPPREATPATLRKYVEGAVAYAGNLGFPPHEEYEIARLLFGDIDPGASSETFEYGKDGKPFFISGPNETQQRSKEIIATLERTCGTGNYHYLMMI